jgi:sec-independent protein translocase protein TatC
VGLFTWRNKTKEVAAGAAEGEMGFFDHLEDLRWHIIRSVIAVGIIAIVLWIFRVEVMGTVFMWPFDIDFPTYKILCKISSMICLEGEINVDFQSIAPFEQFNKSMSYSIFGGVILAFPYIVWEFWRFVKPALKEKEVKAVRYNVWIISFLFLIGALFGYFIILPFSVQFLSTFELFGPGVVENNWRIGDVVSMVLMIIIGTGVLFEFPVIMYFLAKIGLITSSFLASYRKHSVIIILIIAGLVTPPDPFSQTVVGIPMYLLFELGIIVIRRVERNKARAEAIENAKYANNQ